jgi:large subunit ribosomal protein L13
MIVDVKGLVAGRIATKVAKALINGESVVVLNAQDAVVVGNPTSIMEKYGRRVEARVLSNPHEGPKYSRIPSKIFRSMVRNMLPTKKRAKERLIKFLKVYNGLPVGTDEHKKEPVKEFKELAFNERHRSMTLGEIATKLGGAW